MTEFGMVSPNFLHWSLHPPGGAKSFVWHDSGPITRVQRMKTATVTC